MHWFSTRRLGIWLSLLALLAAACGGGEAASAGAAAVPTDTAPPPAVTLSGPNEPTSTVPPGAPTSTPAPESGAEATPAPEATTEVMIGPNNYPAGVNPLTGLSVDDPAVLNRRPLAIKISNFPRYVRPQSGLGIADMVWEHYSEGGTSRFTAIFLAASTDRVGPIRSARLIDTVLAEMVDGALVTSGSSTGTMARLFRKPWFDLVISEETGYQCPPLCRESEDTNSVYASTEVLWQTLDERGLNAAPQITDGLAFHSQPPAGGRAANLLRVDYSSEAHSEWRYSEVANRYHRWVDVSASELEPHADELDGLHIAVENVVVLFANHVVDFNVPEDYDEGGFSGHFATEIQLWATGPALVFRDGQVFEATWVRLASDDMLGLVDAANNPVPLRPGRTWFHTVGLTSNVAEVAPTWMIEHRSPRDVGALPGVDTPTPTPEGFVPSETPEGGEPSATPEG